VLSKQTSGVGSVAVYRGMSADEKPLYERIGGYEAVAAATDHLV
jgi:hypothetical protein